MCNHQLCTQHQLLCSKVPKYLVSISVTHTHTYTHPSPPLSKQKKKKLVIIVIVIVFFLQVRGISQMFYLYT